MKILETLVKVAIPGFAVLISLLPFYCFLDPPDRSIAFNKILDLLLGNYMLLCIIIGCLIVMVYSKIQKDELIRLHVLEKERLESENRELKERMHAFTTELLAAQIQKNKE